MNQPHIRQLAALVFCALLLCLAACTASPADTIEPVSTTVVQIEKYGHAALGITAADFAAAGYEHGDIVSVRTGSYEATVPYFDGYYSDPGMVLLRGLSPESSVALCINYGNFSEAFGTAIGDAVEISMAEKAGALAMQEICALQYSPDRADFSDDIVFANFRAVTAGRIGAGKLYRTASPVNNSYGRAPYANELIAAADVATVLNLSDSAEVIEACFDTDDFDSAYYRTLYEAGAVKPLDLAVNFFSDEFAASVAEGLTFLARNEPPYCIHCLEGKDRAGFTAMLLEALMGAEIGEIIDDYMLSFYNYYGITESEEPQRYQIILEQNLLPMLCHVAGVKEADALSQIDLESAATEYLLHAGMAQEDIDALRTKLN